MPRLTRPPVTIGELAIGGPPVRVRDLVAMTSFDRDTIIQDIQAGALKAFRHGPRGDWRIERSVAREWLTSLGLGSGALVPTLSNWGISPQTQPPPYPDPSILVQMLVAMGLGSILRSGVAIADSVTGGSDGVQVTIMHRAWTARDTYGKPTFASAVSRRCVLTSVHRLIRTAGGQELHARAKLTFLAPITANGASGRREPIDPRDLITLPDGTTGPILDVKGTIDPDTDAPFSLSVWLG